MDRTVVMSTPVCLRPARADIQNPRAQTYSARPLRAACRRDFSGAAVRQVQAQQQAVPRNSVVSCAYGEVASPSAPGLGLPEEIERHYLFGQILGQGAYGTVRYGVNKHSNMECAIKVLPKRRNGNPVTSRSLRKLEREIQIHSVLQECGNVVSLYDVYEDEHNLYLVLEFCRGKTLENHLVANGPLSERQTALIVYEVLKVVAHCHANSILHGDVKAANFVFSRKAAGRSVEEVAASSSGAWLKAIDFGCSQRYNGTPFAMRVGTPVFMAPEVFMRDYALPADIWSAGILFYELFAARFPFWDTLDECKTRTLDEVMKAVIVDDIDFGFGPWKSISATGLDLVRRMLDRDPQTRITATEALQHSWFVEQGVAVPSLAPAVKQCASNIVPLTGSDRSSAAVAPDGSKKALAS